MDYERQNLSDVLSRFPRNTAIQEMVFKTLDHIENEATKDGKIMVSISGGSDSDIMLDLFERIGYPQGLVTYVWYDTGLEYDATKRHLRDLEGRYGIEIKRYRSEITVAQAVKKYGYPFISKEISEKIERGQTKDFDWTSELSFVELMQTHQNAKSFLKWWCDGVRETAHTVRRCAFLKEYMQKHPPQVKISDRCCDATKKRTAAQARRELSITLECIGVRRAEGGIRAMSYHTCFSEATHNKVAQFRPLFYLTDADKQEYKDFCSVRYSDCYEVWGFKRTGCCCCPFGSGFEEELEVSKQYEPKLYKAATAIFGASYEYTRKYRIFKEACKREKRRYGQIDLFDNPDTIVEDFEVIDNA